MKRLFVIACIAAFIFQGGDASAQYKSRVNLSIQSGYALPYASFGDYYDGGFGCEMHVVASLSKRKSPIRLSLLGNTGIYHFAGKHYWAFDQYGNFNEYQSKGFNNSFVHGGVRFDFGNTREIPFGVYLSQDFGTNFLSGSTGGSRYGHTFNMGFLAGRFDMAIGMDAWKRSVGGNFRFFTFRVGVVLF